VPRQWWRGIIPNNLRFLILIKRELNMAISFAVYLEPYSLKEGEVGRDIFRPVYVSRHRTMKAAQRALIRCITGTNPVAKGYLRSVSDVALRYVIWQVEESGAVFHKYSAREHSE
jgi:hypothetical protein